MMSRSRNETVPMWAIAAHTLSRVKETNDNDKRAGREKKISIDQTQGPRCL